MTCCYRTHARRDRGHTLAEILIVVALVAVVAAAALPNMHTAEPARLDLVAQEVVNTLRLATQEARLRNAYVLVDGKTEPGVLRLYVSTATAQVPPTSGTSALNDPLIRRAAVVQPALSSLTRDVTLEARFVGGGQAWGQLLVAPGAGQFWAFDGVATSRGALQANSKIVVSLGGKSVDVNFSELTGLVLRP